jgi:peptidoglycan/LPS O-acetylase OafA/YrhL
MKRIPALDGWRGIAILLVLIDHARAALHLDQGAGASTGPHGVTLFFVLSGFLITSRLNFELQSSGTINLRRFYKQRFFRLMPAAWLYLWFAFLIAMLTPNRLNGAINCAAALLLFRNYSHFLVPDSWMTGHFWTLSIEEQFYIGWPSVMAFAGARVARWAAAFTAIIIAAHRFYVWNSISSTPFPLVNLEGTQLCADSLLAGCALALFLPRIRPYLRDWMAFPLIAALAACVMRYHTVMPLHESLIMAFLLAITSSSHSRVFSLLDWKPVAFLGKISYSLYLWQQPLTTFAEKGPGHFLIAVVALPCMALGSYYFIEKPFIERGRRKS